MKCIQNKLCIQETYEMFDNVLSKIFIHHLMEYKITYIMRYILWLVLSDD